MRASRQTELEETFPTHVVCKWMGNSPKVAQKHYLQVTDSHFEKAVQNPVQQASAMLGTAPLPAPTCDQNTPENAENIGIRDAKINPTRARTWNDRTKICCVTITPPGYVYDAPKSVVAESNADLTEFQADFVQ